MHYYQFNIGDYIKDASHLSLEEEGVYRRLIDLYYTNEKPIELNIKSVSRAIRARGNEDLIELILSEFFIKTEKGFKQKRIDAELKKYKEKSKKAAASAKARWGKGSKGGNKDANAMRTHTEGNANHKTLTTNQEPVLKDIDQSAIERELLFAVFWSAGMKKTGKKNAVKSFERVLKSQSNQGAFVDILCEDIKQRLLINQMGFAEMHPATYLNGERWNDESTQTSKRPNQPVSAVDRVRVANEQRERERQIKYGETGEGMGQAMAATNGNLRTPASEPVRNGHAGELGVVIDGHFTRTD